MLQRLAFLFVPSHVVVLMIVTVVSLGIGEMLADRIHTPQSYRVYDEFQGAVLPLRDFAMPNYWVWYHADDVQRALNAHGHVDMLPLIVLTLYNACMCTWVVGMCHVWVSMCLSVNTVSRRSKWNWIWLVPIVAMIADLVEDLCLLVILINHPMVDYPRLRWWCAWCSFAKFLGWGTCVVYDVAALAHLVKNGPLPKEKL